MTLALIAGSGRLPAAVASAQSVRPLICVLDGFDPDGLEPDIRFRLEHLGSFLKELAARKVREVCLCGAISRPAVNPKAIDFATVPLVPAMLRALKAGDDAALRAVMDAFERKGFTIRAAHELAPDLLAPVGVLTRRKPDAAIEADVQRGQAVLDALAPLDVGQGCVVGKGRVWGIEAAGGTDHLLATLPNRAAEARALLIKEPKAGQDLRADMPTVGADTVASLIAAGLSGLVIRAGGTLLLDRDEMIRQADAAGLVLWAREAR
ncbi:MAG: UDP-2,3-diacylglucosamine diphosphatase LpxI [Pseudomonadota bacterium]